MPIEYDASRDALLRPELGETLFAQAPQPTDMQLAVECARLAYYRFDETDAEQARLKASLQLAGFDAVRHFVGDAFSSTEAFGALRASDGTAVLAFRGTQSDKMADLGTDADFRPEAWEHGAGKVHSGFSRAYAAVHEPIKQWLADGAAARSRLIICGHSLGAALATLCASANAHTLLVTLGGPRVGDLAFVNSLDLSKLRRLAGCCDLVARVPPEVLGYVHPAPLTYISHDGALHENPGKAFIAQDREVGRTVYMDEHAWRKGTVLVRDLADHAPINYARAFF